MIVIDYYTAVSLILLIIGSVIIIFGVKQKSHILIAFGVIPIFTVALYWASLLNTWVLGLV